MHRKPRCVGDGNGNGSLFIFCQTLDISLSLRFYHTPSNCHLILQATPPLPEIKKGKQRLEGVGDDKSHRSIIYRFPDLQHSPQTPHGALQFLRLCSLWRLFIFHFLKGSILTKIKLISLLLCLTVQVGHKSPKLDPNTRLVCHSYQKRMNRYNK